MAENVESSSLLLLATSIPLFTMQGMEYVTTKEECTKENKTGGVYCGGNDNVKREMPAGIASEAADAAKLLLLCHSNRVPANGQLSNHKNSTDGNQQPVVRGEEVNGVMKEFGKINHETNNGGVSHVESMTPPEALVSPKSTQALEGLKVETSSSKPRLGSLIDLATKELLSLETETEGFSSSSCNNDAVDDSTIKNGCGSVIRNDAEENGLVNRQHCNSNGFKNMGMVTRHGRTSQRPRSVSDPEGVYEWGYDRVTNRFDPIKEESYEDGAEENSCSILNFVAPHNLTKYASTYNKHGRVGIYTSKERAAIILRFKAKRERRMWHKKIRYNCRKSLAEKRARVKGRFVKLSGTDAPQKAARGKHRPRSDSSASRTSEDGPDSPMEDVKWEDGDAEICHRVRRHSIA